MYIPSGVLREQARRSPMGCKGNCSTAHAAKPTKAVEDKLAAWQGRDAEDATAPGVIAEEIHAIYEEYIRSLTIAPVPVNPPAAERKAG